MAKKAKDDGDVTRRKVREAVAKHLRFNTPTKAAQIKGRKVEYFSGSRAVDCLMESKWNKTSTDSEAPYFNTRVAASDFCSHLLRERLFVRLKKTDVVPRASDEPDSLRKRASSQTAGNETEAKTKRKKKFRLELHEQQVFVDSADEVYYWEYDPPSKTTYIIGFAIVVGAIALTLQPLWPESTRATVWYGSMGLLGVMGSLVALIIARWFVFGLIQVFTLGKLHFWVLPNLDNEKCGFLESFKPFYSIEWKLKSKSPKNQDSKNQD